MDTQNCLLLVTIIPPSSDSEELLSSLLSGSYRHVAVSADLLHLAVTNQDNTTVHINLPDYFQVHTVLVLATHAYHFTLCGVCCTAFNFCIIIAAVKEYSKSIYCSPSLPLLRCFLDTTILSSLAPIC